MRIETEAQAKQFILDRVGAELSYQNNLEDLLNKYAKALLKAKDDDDINLILDSLKWNIINYIETLATANTTDEKEKRGIILFLWQKHNGEDLQDVITRHVNKWHDGLSEEDENHYYYPLTRYGRFMIAWGWTKLLFDSSIENGAIYFTVHRGSSYPCSTCDFECSYIHYDLMSLPPYHASCKCYIVPHYQPKLEIL